MTQQINAVGITLPNRLSPTYEMPQTGGVGTEIFTFGGIAAIAAALMWGCTLKRKYERGTVYSHFNSNPALNSASRLLITEKENKQ